MGQCRSSLCEANLHVRADPNLLTIILQNLLSNALKYAPNAPVLIGCNELEMSVDPYP